MAHQAERKVSPGRNYDFMWYQALHVLVQPVKQGVVAVHLQRVLHGLQQVPQFFNRQMAQQ